MKARLRDAIAEVLFDDLIPDAGSMELGLFETTLADLRTAAPELQDKLADLERVAGGYAVALAEEAFVADLECGRDIRLLVCKTST